MPSYLPPADENVIIRLHDYYFQSTDLMYESFAKLLSLYHKNGRLSPNNIIKLQSFFQLWLATLYVVVEGFQSTRVRSCFESLPLDPQNRNDTGMKIHWNSIHHKISQLGNELRGYRNVTLHFQDTMTRLESNRFSFLNHKGRHSPIEWARELHNEMRMFFSEYRSAAGAHYLLQQLGTGGS